jgi:PAS domain S-box-containing protein
MRWLKKPVDRLQTELPDKLLEAVDALVVVLDPEGKIVLFNQKCQELSGYRESEVKGRLIWNLLLPKHALAAARSYFDELTSGHFSATHTHPWLTRAGQERLIQWRSTTIADSAGKLSWVVATGIDITEQKQRLDEMQKTITVLNNDPAPVLQLDRQGKITFCNPAALQAFEKRRLEGEDWRKVCPGLNAAAFDRFLKTLEGRRESGRARGSEGRSGSAGPGFSVEARLGNQLYAFDLLALPELGIVQVFGRNTTAGREAQEKSKETEVLSRTLLESGLDAVFSFDGRGVILDCNPASEKLLGYRRNELVGKNLAKLKLFPQRQLGSLTRLPAGRSAGPDELELTHKDGRRISAAVSRTALRRGNKTEIVVVARDVTDRKRTTEELARCRERLQELTTARVEETRTTPRPNARDQLEIAARLAARLELDLTVRLGAIRNSACRLELSLGPNPDPRARNELKTILSTTEQIRDFVSELKTHLHVEAGARARTRVSDLIGEALSRAGVPESIAVERRLSGDLPPIEIDRDQVTRALMAVVRNALEAMPQGGKLVVGANCEGNDVVIAVTDTGPGIAAEHRREVFQPFFTTKPDALGLGLTLAREILQANQGRIEFDSQPGKGTTFRLRLPAIKERSQPLVAAEVS